MQTRTLALRCASLLPCAFQRARVGPDINWQFSLAMIKHSMQQLGIERQT
jgi:hypothetical protein